jgi:hypothetical protein
MIDGSERLEFDNVEVIRSDGVTATCRVGERIVAVPWRRMLPGTGLVQTGDRGRLILAREVAVHIGIV